MTWSRTAARARCLQTSCRLIDIEIVFLVSATTGVLAPLIDGRFRVVKGQGHASTLLLVWLSTDMMKALQAIRAV